MNFPRLQSVHLIVYDFFRFTIAVVILGYAWSKIFGTQFSNPNYIYDDPIGSLDGMSLTWFYYGYSHWYACVIAGVQILSALLLFFRRTVRIGIILFLSFMVNILLTDIAYHIPVVIGSSGPLTLMALFILASDYPALLKFFLNDPAPLAEIPRPKVYKPLSFGKYFLLPILFIAPLLATYYVAKHFAPKKSELYGTWKLIDSNKRKWNKVSFGYNSIHIRLPDGDRFLLGKAKIDESEKLIDVNVWDGELDTWTVNFEQLEHDNKLNEKDLHLIFRGSYFLGRNELILKNDQEELHFLRIR